MAAVQLARYLGAEVYATASPAKWDTLRAMGLDDEHIASSRSTDFAEQFLAATGGSGVRVVLGSLAGDIVEASLRLLADDGRLIEMGKTDVRDPDEVAADHPGVRYRAFDLGDVDPSRIGEMLAQLLELFHRGTLRPLPLTTWDVREAPEAFRFLGSARHIGKIVLTVPARLDPNGTALITGGTGTLGGLVARHLVTAHGIRNLVLAGRRGAAATGAAELRAELTALGATVTIAACDVSDREAVRALLSSVPAEHPLTAVVHSAGVLDDVTITGLGEERLDRVFGPKVDAALALHELTEGMDLAAFVLFSSAAATFGDAGQGNYAAANAFLDAFAQHRRALGLPATSMAWGLWAERSGMTGHLGVADVARMRRSGTLELTSAAGLAMFDAAVAGVDPQVVAMALDPALARTPPPKWSRCCAGWPPHRLVAGPLRATARGCGPSWRLCRRRHAPRSCSNSCAGKRRR